MYLGDFSDVITPVKQLTKMVKIHHTKKTKE